jgi:DNA primase
MTDTVAEIKSRLSIVDIVSPYVKLKRAGKSLQGLCPFHKEKTPSFHVSADRGSWHCFGCGLGGDGFSFIEKIEGVDFKGALKILAEKAGVQIEYSGRSPEAASKKDRLRSLMARASQWYATSFKGSPAEIYAKSRGLTDETIAAWQLGFAPDAWRSLLEALTAEGFTVEEMLAAGLTKEADGKPGTYYDRFRNRLMFPIKDSAGRVVAFTGRILPSNASVKEEGEPAKYLNSPETDLFHKSEILFGMDVAKEAIRTRGFACLVEGQMDVLMSHQAGFKNTVALSGTALSPIHLSLMKRYSENLMLVLDADQAGLRATARSAELALSHGLRVKAARLPSGKDPADLVREDAKEFAKRIKEAKPIVEFFLAELAEKEKDQHRLRRTAEMAVLPLISAIQSPMEREHFVQVMARSLGLSEESIKESLKKTPKAFEPSDGMKSVEQTDLPSVKNAADVRLEQLLAVVHAYPDTPLAKRIKSEYCRVTEAHELPALVPPESAIFEAEQTFGEDPAEDAATELINAFEKAVIRKAYEEAVANLRRAETSGDIPLIEDAQKVCARLSARLTLFEN